MVIAVGHSRRVVSQVSLQHTEFLQISLSCQHQARDIGPQRCLLHLYLAQFLCPLNSGDLGSEVHRLFSVAGALQRCPSSQPSLSRFTLMLLMAWIRGLNPYIGVVLWRLAPSMILLALPSLNTVHGTLASASCLFLDILLVVGVLWPFPFGLLGCLCLLFSNGTDSSFESFWQCSHLAGQCITSEILFPGRLCRRNLSASLAAFCCLPLLSYGQGYVKPYSMERKAGWNTR